MEDRGWPADRPHQEDLDLSDLSPPPDPTVAVRQGARRTDLPVVLPSTRAPARYDSLTDDPLAFCSEDTRFSLHPTQKKKKGSTSPYACWLRSSNRLLASASTLTVWILHGSVKHRSDCGLETEFSCSDKVSTDTSAVHAASAP